MLSPSGGKQNKGDPLNMQGSNISSSQAGSDTDSSTSVASKEDETVLLDWDQWIKDNFCIIL